MDKNDMDPVLNQIKRFSCFKNPNNFDEYFMNVLPTNREKPEKNTERNKRIHSGERMIELTPPRKMSLKPMERLEATNIERKKEIEAALRKKRERSRQLKEVKNKSEEQPIAKNTLKETNEVNSDDNIENVCVICGWVFPIGINKKYIKYHLNQCLDGNGQKSKEEILTSMKMDKLCKGPIKVDGPTCPICGKRFKTKNSKAKVNHVTDCQKNFQENDFAATHKRTSRIDFEYDI